MTSETGFALARAHHAYAFRHYPYRANIDERWQVYLKKMDEQRRPALDRVMGAEVACKKWYYQQALDYIRAHPLETILHGCYTIGITFQGILSPLHGWFKNWIYAISYWPTTLLALLGLPLPRSTPFLRVFLEMIVAQSEFCSCSGLTPVTVAISKLS
jgi:hypothetical protein